MFPTPVFLVGGEKNGLFTGGGRHQPGRYQAQHKERIGSNRDGGAEGLVQGTDRGAPVTVKIVAKSGKTMPEQLSRFEDLWLRLYTDTTITDDELDRVQTELRQVGVEWLHQGVRCNWGKHPFNERGHEAYEEWLCRKANADHVWFLGGASYGPGIPELWYR